MCATLSAARRRARVAKPSRGRSARRPPPMVVTEPASNLAEGAGCSYVDLGDSVRLALMITPRGSGKVREQVREVFSVIRTVLEKQPQPMAVTVQTVFLKDARDRAECERAFAEFYGPRLPVTNFVLQAALLRRGFGDGGLGHRGEGPCGSSTLARRRSRSAMTACAGFIVPGVTPGASVRGVLSANPGCAGAFAGRPG